MKLGETLPVELQVAVTVRLCVFVSRRRCPRCDDASAEAMTSSARKGCRQPGRGSPQRCRRAALPAAGNPGTGALLPPARVQFANMMLSAHSRDNCEDDDGDYACRGGGSFVDME